MAIDKESEAALKARIDKNVNVAAKTAKGTHEQRRAGQKAVFDMKMLRRMKKAQSTDSNQK